MQNTFQNTVWDPSLMFVMMAGMIPNAFAYHFLIKSRTKPILADLFQFPTRRDIDWKLISGAALFGIGWGYSGLCPGPGFITTFVKHDSSVLPWTSGFIAGVVAHRWFVWASEKYYNDNS